MAKKYNFRLNEKRKKDGEAMQFLEERKLKGYSYTDTIVIALEEYCKRTSAAAEFAF